MTLKDTTTRMLRAASRPRLTSLPLRDGEIVGGKYEITGILGEGGMGAVYHGRHARFRREVAIKVLHPLLSRDKLMVRRFEREAQAAGRIGSEHIVEVLDAGTFAGGERYIVMEYLEGESLAARLDRQGTLRATEIYPIAVQLLDGLAAAHDARFVHRDLKPSNVFLMRSYEGREDFVKILDFGVSKLNAVDAGDVTQTGVLLGTPHFMAPELIRGARHADHRSDLYAVGVILFRALTGLTPFVGANAYELLHKIAREDAPPVRHFALEIDEEFAAIVDCALRRDPADRFADARAFGEALRRWGKSTAKGLLEVAPLRAPSTSLPSPAPRRERRDEALPPPPRAAAEPPAARRPRIARALTAAALLVAAGLAAAGVWLSRSADLARISAAGAGAAAEVLRATSAAAEPPVEPKAPLPERTARPEPAVRVAPGAPPPDPPKPPPAAEGYAPEVGEVTF